MLVGTGVPVEHRPKRNDCKVSHGFSHNVFLCLTRNSRIYLNLVYFYINLSNVPNKYKEALGGQSLVVTMKIHIKVK